MRIKEARMQKGLSQMDLANMLGTTQAAVSKWELGARFPRRKTLEQIASLLGVSVAYLMGEDAAELEPSVDAPTKDDLSGNISAPEKITEFISVPVIDMRACAGLGTSHEYEDIEVERILPLPAQLVGAIAHDAERRPFAVHIDGDSMSDAGLYDGMLAVVNPVEDVYSGDVAMVCFGDMQDVAIKRVYYYQDGDVEIRSATPGFPVHRYARNDCEPIGDLPPKFRILGKVMGAWSVPKRG